MIKILVLGTADWNQPIATNQHYVVRELAEQFDVLYLESMGLRQPELRWRDIRRILLRLRRSSSAQANREIPSRATIKSPRVIPRHRGISARVNHYLTRRILKAWIHSVDTRILWAYTPVTYGLEEYADGAIYHCVDLLATVEGISAEVVERNERRLALSGVKAIGSSNAVVAHLQNQGFSSVRAWPNVADTERIGLARPADGRRLKRVVFAGNLSEQKVDFDLLNELVKCGADLHLAGPVSEGGGSAAHSVGALVKAGATYHGMLAFDELARLYWTASVGLIPYQINEYTNGVNPLKTFEYLRAGLFVVSTPVPAVVPIKDDVVVATTRAEFVAAVLSSPDPDPKSVSRRIAMAEQHSWSTRGEQARATVEALVRERSDTDV